jgi:hypothetical protein
MANVTALEKKSSLGFGSGPQLGKWIIDFDAADFVDANGNRVSYTSGDSVRLTPVIPTGSAMAVLAVSTVMLTASTAGTSSTIDVGFDAGETLVANINGKTATTRANAALANPIYGDAATYLTLTNTLVGTGLKGKIAVSVLYSLM